MALTQDSLPQLPGQVSVPGSAGEYLDKLQNRLVPQARDSVSIDGFVFDYAGIVSSTMGADITDHFAETNDFVNDHIGLRPKRIEMRGIVAELSQTAEDAQGVITRLQNALTTIPAFLGAYTPTQVGKLQAAITKAQDVENQLNKALAQGRQLTKFFPSSSATQTKQQKAYAELEAKRDSRSMFQIVTPWRIYNDMVIENLGFSQDEKTKVMTDIQVTLRQMRFASVLSVPYYLSRFEGRAAYQNSAPVNVGRNAGKKAENSLLYNLTNFGNKP